MSTGQIQFLPGVSAEHILQRLHKAGGKEVESGKLESPESSAALAVNTFGWFVDRPHMLPSIPGIQPFETPTMVDVEYCARFPWRGGRHPWLDAIVETQSLLIGVESKRYEPYRDRKSVELSQAYDRPVWGDHMGPYERMRDRLRSGEMGFEYLDAAQLVKHAFGLVTDARRKSRQPVLFYLFAEPAMRGRSKLQQEDFDAHRSEIEMFASEVSGAAVKFTASSYRDWLSNWGGCPPEVAAHGQAILETFAP